MKQNCWVTFFPVTLTSQTISKQTWLSIRPVEIWWVTSPIIVPHGLVSKTHKLSETYEPDRGHRIKMIFCLLSDKKEGSYGINCNGSVIRIMSSSYYFNIAVLYSFKLQFIFTNGKKLIWICNFKWKCLISGYLIFILSILNMNKTENIAHEWI